MPASDPLKIISVTGAHSGVGKTALCSTLLENLKGFGAIKFTKTSLYASLVDDMTVLGKKGKDTARFLESGAQRVLWIKSPYNELEGLLEIAMGKMSDLNGVIIEGNSPVDFLNPHLLVFIIGPDGELKPSAIKVGGKADIIIINSAQQSEYPDSLSLIKKDNTKVFRIDLIKKNGEFKEFLSHVKRRINRVTY